MRNRVPRSMLLATLLASVPGGALLANPGVLSRAVAVQLAEIDTPQRPALQLAEIDTPQRPALQLAEIDTPQRPVLQLAEIDTPARPALRPARNDTSVRPKLQAAPVQVASLSDAALATG